MSSNEYIILKVLFDNNKTTTLNNMKVSEIIELVKDQFKKTTVYSVLKSLLDKEYIAYGLLYGKTNSYYITQKGIEILESLK